MRGLSVKPNDYILVAALKACASTADLTSGKLVHSDVIDNGYESNVFVGSTLIDMYAKCGSLEAARRVFDSMPKRNVVTWNAMIAGYTQHGLGGEALNLYETMQHDGIFPDSATFVSILKACGSIGAVKEGTHIHEEVLKGASGVDLSVWNTLVDMYAKCGCLQEAQKVFDSLGTRNVVTWNALIAGYVQHGLGQEALNLYMQMQEDGQMPDNVTFLSILRACTITGALTEGKQVHADIMKSGVAVDVFVGSSLVDMYAKCGSLEDSCQVFNSLTERNVVAYNAMIAGYAQCGLGQEALHLYREMQTKSITPDVTTFLCILKACGSIGAEHEGKQICSQVAARELERDASLGISMLDMYVKCGNVKDARAVFDKMQTKSVVTWNAMIAGYAQNGHGQESLELYSDMQQCGILADTVTFVSLLKACGSLGASREGKQMHSQILERGLQSDVMVQNTLVDMYAKCGSLGDAQRVFDSMSTRNVVTWNAIINGYGQHNDCETAIQRFEDMQLEGVAPDAATFTSVLVACSHAGLVSEGFHYFQVMTKEHGILPTDDHYMCMVDLLGRSGRLHEAHDMLVFSGPQTTVGWISLLSACKTHSSVEWGSLCFDQLTALEPEEASAYALMSDIYVAAGRWKDAHHVGKLKKHVAAQKLPAKALLELSDQVLEFNVGDSGDHLSAKLRSLNCMVDESRGASLEGSASSDNGKEDTLCGHAEKLALAHGLLNTPEGTALLVTKNLRMCDNCHNGTKIISKVEKREIIIRDAHRVHHFKDGFCSCGDNH